MNVNHTSGVCLCLRPAQRLSHPVPLLGKVVGQQIIKVREGGPQGQERVGEAQPGSEGGKTLGSGKIVS